MSHDLKTSLELEKLDYHSISLSDVDNVSQNSSFLNQGKRIKSRPHAFGVTAAAEFVRHSSSPASPGPTRVGGKITRPSQLTSPSIDLGYRAHLFSFLGQIPAILIGCLLNLMLAVPFGLGK